MEVSSSNMHRQAESKARKVAADRGILTFHNSDAHDAFIVGMYINELDINLTCVEDFITYVHKHGSKPSGHGLDSKMCLGIL